jgi:thioredoxin reductase
MSSRTADHFDAVIIGGGPAGLSAALLLGRACRRVVLIDAGEPRNAAARELHGFLSRDGIPPRELLRLGRAEVERYGIVLIDDRVISAHCLCDRTAHAGGAGFSVQCASGREFTGRKLLFASGTCDTLPELPGIKECYGASVHHCPYCDGWEHRQQRLLACGDTADHAAGLGLALKTWSNRVLVLTNGEPLPQDQHDHLRANQISWREERVLRLVHDGDRLRAVELSIGEVIEADALFFNTPQTPRCDLACQLGCQLDDAARVQTSDKQRTNVPGIFFAGDADGDVQFAIVAAAEGATAAVAINRELQDEDESAAR